MTTPAVNRNLVTSTMARVITSSDTIPPYSTDLGLQDVGWDAESRPSSGNAGRIHGYLLCRPWSHAGRQWSVSGGACQSRFLSGTHLKRVWPGTSFWNAGNHLSPPTPTMPSLNLINSVEVKALNKLKSQDVHLGNFLAEGKKTINMVAGTAHNIARQIESFRRGSPSGWKRVVDNQRGHSNCKSGNCVPNAWLQLQYGWSPLLSDIVGSMTHLYRRSRFEIPFVTVKASGGSSRIISSTVSSAYLSGLANLEFVEQVKVYITLVYGLSNPNLAELSSLGLINPVEIAWELLRYSFVIDWFLPVGAWLSALTGDAGYTFINGTKSMTTELKFKGVRSVSYSSPGQETSISPPSYGGRDKQFSRTCYGGSPVPGLYVKNPLSIDHVLNGIALMKQAMS